jgi:hypothetical protein
MADWETPEPPQPKHWHDRPSARTAEEREAAFQRFLELSAPYFQKIEAEGDRPSFSSEGDRRERYFRRYTRPAPPAGLPPVDLAVIRGEHRRWSPASRTNERKAA